LSQRRNSVIISILISILILLTINNVFGADNPIVGKNIEFVNADLRDVFRSLAEAGKFNVIMEQTVHGDVSLTLKYGVTLKDAVAVIAKTYGYSCRWLADSTTAVIGSANFIKINFDHKTTKVFQLSFANPADVAASLAAVIPKTRIKTDMDNKQITVLANEVELDNIMEIITNMDRESPKIDIEAKIFEVSNQIWKDININNTFLAPHMGIYLLKEQQVRALVESPKNNLMLKSDLAAPHNQKTNVFFGDKVPLISEKNKQGGINYKVEYIDIGTHVSIVPKFNKNNKFTLTVTTTVSTMANKAGTGKSWIPWVVTRDYESTIRLDDGQAFLLSGLLQRSEYNMMKDSPYNFPILSKLFIKENPALQGIPNSQTEVVFLLTPKLQEKTKVEDDTETKSEASDQKNSVVQNPMNSTNDVIDKGTGSVNTGSAPPTLTNQNSQPDQLVAGSDDKLPIDEEKPEVKITGRVRVTDGYQKPVVPDFIETKYQVKKGDTLTSIVKKFGSDLAAVVAKNKLEPIGIINPDAILIIPVPSERCYTLKMKETLWRISKRYGTTLAVLKDLNGIADETKVKAGQPIILPVPVTKVVNPQF
jgi:Type II secretory pathway, component PulD